jgi:hypothetical protein
MTSNTGDYNTGHYNTGYRNTGDCNTGYYNTGHRNSGHYNTGDCNTGDRNTGDYNTGDYNTGHRNSGHYNTGDCNTGDCNTGYYNTGDYNTGDCNTGDCNTGYYNTGDYNSTNYSSGVLCTEKPNCLIFDMPSGMTVAEWRRTKASQLMSRIEFTTTEWINENEMSDDEKKSHPEFYTTGGYLKVINSGYRFTEWWDALTDDEKDIIKAIPNFDAVKWKKITGIAI